MNFSYSSRTSHVKDEVRDYAWDKLSNILERQAREVFQAELLFEEVASRYVVKLRTKGKLSLALESAAYSHYFEAIDDLVEKLSANVRRRKCRKVKRKRLRHLKLLEPVSDIAMEPKGPNTDVEQTLWAYHEFDEYESEQRAYFS